MTRWPLRRVSRDKTAERALGDKVHRATLHTVGRRAQMVAQIPSWAALREQARAARLRALAKHDELLARFVERLEQRGVQVTVALTATKARSHITRLVLEAGGRVIKGKSMTSEELGLNQALEAAGAQVTETDLGELIVQLAGQPPSHITAPAIHLSTEDIARIFAEHLGMAVPSWALEGRMAAPETRRDLAKQLSLHARAHLRERFLNADVGITGANFLVADTGTVVLVENEGNIQLSSTLPARHIVLAGIDKLIESEADLAVLLQLLPVSATAQRQTCYVSRFADAHPDMHVVLLDHGRSTLMQDGELSDLLTCIRCGACMNACPVYRNIGGHAYGGAYSGPIGALLMPHLEGLERYAELPFASSLCGACAEVCPVKIPLDDHLLTMRARLTDRGHAHALGWSLGASAQALRRPEPLAVAAKLYPWLRPLASLSPAGRAWSATRDLPRPAQPSFRSWWRQQHGSPSTAAVARPTTTGPSRLDPATAARDDAPAPPVRPAPTEREPSTPLERFTEHLAQLGPEGESELHHVASATAAVGLLRERLAEHPPEAVWLAGEPSAKREYALSIVTATALVADTGGVVLCWPDRVDGRAVALAETLLVVGQPEQLVDSLSEALLAGGGTDRAEAPEGIRVLVTGPSRTADVEKVLVIPAHGPRRLVVVLCDEPVDLSRVRYPSSR